MRSCLHLKRLTNCLLQREVKTNAKTAERFSKTYNQINGTHCKKPKRFGASLRCSLNSRSFTGERNLNFVLIETVNGSDAILQHQKSSVIEMKRVRQARLVDNSVLKGIT